MNNFDVDYIHNLRVSHEIYVNLSLEERRAFYHEKALKVREAIEALRKAKNSINY